MPSAHALECETDTIRLAVGVMSGTSIDGLDAALVRLEGEGLGIRATLVHHLDQSLGDLAPRLRGLAGQQPVAAGEIAGLAWEFALLHVQLIERLLSPSPPCPPAHRPPQPDVIAVHGQTVFHRPPISFQLINPAPIAARWPNAIVISDLRQRDLAEGGQGAPITPLADWVLFRSEARSRAIVNLGGFCNVTIVPRATFKARELSSLGALAGADVCACNHILDSIARLTMNAPYDEGGRGALAGSINPQAESKLFDAVANHWTAGGNPRLFLVRGRSLGTGDEALDWIGEHRGRMSPNDLAATACSAIGRAIAAALSEHEIDELILAGGGAFNEALVAAIQRRATCEVIRSDALGVPIQAREAMAMAILGALNIDRIPITLPQITGRRAIQAAACG